VLFIDEAYSLTPSSAGSGADYGAEAVAAILRHMENHRGRIAVIVAGYEKEMGRFLESNPGLRSRFGTAIDFPRYSADELVDIFEAMAQQHGLNHDPKVRAAVQQRLSRSGSGNARAVRTLIEQATRRMASRALADGRIDDHELQDLLVEDILGAAGSPQRQEILTKAMADLDALVGLGEVKQHVRDLVARQMWTRARIDAGMTVPDVGMDLVFTGSPGTGKTTVARIVARIYQGLGLLDSGHLVEVTRKDLVGQYVGQTAATTQSVLDRAAGGVLFVDEAYALIGGGQWDYGPEAVATLLSHMENNRGSLAVIAAGYQDEMDAFLASNPGLRSRFGTVVEFEDYSADELVAIFAAICAEQGLECPDDVLSAVRDQLGSGAAGGAGGNARFVRQLVETSVDRLAARAAADGTITGDELRVLTVADLPPVERPTGFGFAG
jgi:SpoVK/Ycf46/Vps4 family AAA+-type ATPase